MKKTNDITTPDNSIQNDEESEAKKISEGMSRYRKKIVLSEGLDQLAELRKSGEKEATLNEKDPIFKMMTLYEFDNGHLLSCGVSEAFKAMIVDLSHQFQKEFDCKTYSEMALAHLASQNFVRTLELQKYIKMLLDRETYNDTSTRRVAVLQKALDQASRQFSFNIQTLKNLRQQPINVTVKAVTANIGNQQLIQENHEA